MLSKPHSSNSLVHLARLWRMVWAHSEGRRGKVVFFVVLFFFANLVSMSEPLIVGWIFNRIQTLGLTPGNMPYLALLFLLLPLREVVFWFFHGPARVMEQKNAFLAKVDYQRAMMKGVLSMPLAWHADHQSGDTIDKVERSSEALYSFAENSFGYIQIFLSLAMSLAVLSYFSPIAGLSTATLTLAAFFAMAWYDRRIVPAFRQVNYFENARAAVVYDTLSNVNTVVTLRLKDRALNSISEALYRARDLYGKAVTLTELKWWVASILSRLVAFFSVAAYLYSHDSGPVMVGTLYILYGYAARVADVFFDIASRQSKVVRLGISLSNAQGLRDAFSSLPERPSIPPLPSSWRQIGITGLNFSYHGADGTDLHLDDLSLNIDCGSRVALIGESGGGKSSFLKVLRGLYEATASVTVDGKPLPGGLGALGEASAMVPQDPELFATTVRENITFGEQIEEGRLLAATDMAMFTSVARALPRGLDSAIKERGVNLSGGEKQRLALARGILAAGHFPIILLDEPTSSVDFHNELVIYNQLFAFYQGRTIISAVHRLHLLPLFDVIHIFKDGRIVASGSFASLLGSSVHFSELWQKYLKTHVSEAE